MKLLVICGPTSTGKSSLGISLAQQFSGEIISADSRQVYKGFDIGSGKLRSDSTPIWGYDLVSPSEEFSASHFQLYAKEKINEIVTRHNLPILVGGTGLYISSVIGNLEALAAPRDEQLRRDMSGLSAQELFKILLKKFPERALSLNDSDRKNPVRLFRAFERGDLRSENITTPSTVYDVLIIGLTSTLPTLFARIDQSIRKRISSGFDEEVRGLLKAGIPQTSKAFTGTGYRQWIPYVVGSISQKQAISDWATAEKQYVKRQLTWFKKQKDVHWVDIADANYQEKVEELVRKWHNSV